jgi:hypothetical protein
MGCTDLTDGSMRREMNIEAFTRRVTLHLDREGAMD